MLATLVAGLALVGHAPATGRARGQVAMKATPRVPFKSRDSDYTQWVDIYNRMYRERIIFLSQDIDDDFANVMISVLLYLESEDSKSPVSMYFNVAGGKTKPGLALHDTMTNMPYDIQTVNMGIVAETAAFLVAGGTPGKRFALPNSRFLMQSPSMMPPMDNEGKPIQRVMQATEMQLEVAEVLRDKRRLLEGYSQFTGKPMQELEQDFKRDFFLNAQEAMDYGLVDKLTMPKRLAKLKAKDDPERGPNEEAAQKGQLLGT
jgi:ATP-dependent Clp protease protease subunit